MESKRLGGGALVAVSVIAPWVADMADLSLPGIVAYPILAVCVVMAALGLWLLFRRTKMTDEPDNKANRVKAALRLENCGGSKFGTVIAVGCDSAVDATDSEGLEFKHIESLPNPSKSTE